MIVGFTGHRPGRLGGFGQANPIRARVIISLRKALEELKPSQAISGMALGFDQWAARCCLELGIPFVAAVPFDGQDDMWMLSARLQYRALLTSAVRIHVVCPGPYAAYKMQKRNEYIVDNSDFMVVAWDGSDGGTANCMRYIEEIHKPFKRLVW